ncbi:Lactose permease [Pseudocercospora fuligena]|uniref:Lactose permease n=1 Tax=Pseudocercospora fuligena TaxID=685502 RepID=A0A8H6VMT0_9PEZI|nr:Lactose permease [Pseudocercospora fuligena]
MADKKISRLVPRSQRMLIACLILVSAIDSVMVGYNSSLMGSLNVMPTYTSYFHLNTSTKALQTAISYSGGAFVSLFAGFLLDWRGRRQTIFVAIFTALIGSALQAAAQNVGMFISARFIIGMGMGLAQTAAPTLVSETTPPRYRGFALGMFYACWGVGTLIASGVCYATQDFSTTWAWRTPTLLQAGPAIVAASILFFVPESPRWLISRDRHEEAMEVLSIVNNFDQAQTDVHFREILDTITFEKQQNLSLLEALTTKHNRRRLLIVTTFSIIVMLPGTNIVTFYFGDMMSNAGIESADTQLQINIVLTAWTLIIAVAASFYADKIGRKWLCSLSLAGQIVTLFLLGGLTKLYGTSSNNGGIYATLAMIFLYNGFYAWGITPLTVLYPPEVLPFEIRGIGMSIYTFTTKCCGLFVAMVIPFGLNAIGYQFYFVNACFDILMIVFVVLVWVETRGMTLEEVDVLFNKEKRQVVVEQIKEEMEGSISVQEVAKVK